MKVVKGKQNINRSRNINRVIFKNNADVFAFKNINNVFFISKHI